MDSYAFGCHTQFFLVFFLSLIIKCKDSCISNTYNHSKCMGFCLFFFLRFFRTNSFVGESKNSEVFNSIYRIYLSKSSVDSTLLNK